MIMRKRIAAATLCLLSLIGVAHAQINGMPNVTLSPNTIIGNNLPIAGAPNAIPFAAVAAGLLQSLTGDLTCSVATQTCTISNGVVTNGKLANMAAGTVKCRSATSTGAPQDCNYPIVSAGDPAYGAKCDGTTDDTAAIQAAGNAAITLNAILFIPPSALGCIVSQNGANSWALQWSSPIVIMGSPGFSIIRPATGLANTVDIIDFVGTANTYQRTVVSGVMIGNPTVATRTGRHALRFDSTGVNQNFFRPIIRDNFIQDIASGTGTSVFVNNSAANNPGGGFITGLIDNNLIGSGVSLNSAGDSIRISHNNFAGSTNNDAVYANLVANAGNLQIVGNDFGVDASSVHLDCAKTFDISGNQLEHTNVSSTNAIINAAGGVCSLLGGTITNNEITVITGGGVNHPIPIVLGTSSGISVDGNTITTFSAYTPFTIAAGAAQAKVGCQNYFGTVSGLNTLTDSSTTTVYCHAQQYVGHSLHSATCAINTTCVFLNDIQPTGADGNVFNRALTAGLFKNFTVFFPGAPGAGQTYTVTLRKNAADTAITCTVSGAGTNTCADTTHTVTAAATDNWNFKVVLSATAVQAQDIQWSIEFDPYVQ